MTTLELINALKGLKVQTGSLACLGCGHEHNCGIHGCAIIREAAERISSIQSAWSSLPYSIDRLLELYRAAEEDRVVVHGHWIPISYGAWAECSECGEYYDVSDNCGMSAFKLFCNCYKHCPNCGAKMDGGTENG